MTTPTAQQIFNWVADKIEIDTPGHPLREYMSDALAELSRHLNPLAILEIVDERLPQLASMFEREQVRAVAEGVTRFEILGADDPVLKGFAVALPRDTVELASRRRRAHLTEPVRNALLRLSSDEFEALWALLVQHLGGQRFKLLGRTGDGGIDFTAEFNLYRLSRSLPHAAQEWLDKTETRSIITIIGQAKHTPDATLLPAILRELVGSMFLHIPDIGQGQRKGGTGMLVTTGRFSANADAQARRANIVCLDGEWVASAIVNFGLGVVEGPNRPIFKEGTLKMLIRERLEAI